MAVARAIAVTGASGFIGRQLCAELCRSGTAFRAVVRRPHRESSTLQETVVAPNLELDALRRAFAGVHAVVHLAGRAHVTDERGNDQWNEYYQANVEATRRAIDAAAAERVRRFILISTVKAVGEATAAGTIWDEGQPALPADHYGRSKLQAERIAHQEGVRGGLETVVFRLPLVYGPGMRANMLRLFHWVNRGLPLPFADVPNRRSLIFVGNVVSAITHALHARAASGTYFVTDGHDLSTAELIRAVASALRRPARLVRVPLPLLRGVARLGDAASSIVRVPWTTAALDRLTNSLAVDPNRFVVDTAWTPSFTIEEGLQRTAAWYLSEYAHPRP